MTVNWVTVSHWYMSNLRQRGLQWCPLRVSESSSVGAQWTDLRNVFTFSELYYIFFNLSRNQFNWMKGQKVNGYDTNKWTCHKLIRNLKLFLGDNLQYSRAILRIVRSKGRRTIAITWSDIIGSGFDLADVGFWLTLCEWTFDRFRD